MQCQLFLLAWQKEGCQSLPKNNCVLFGKNVLNYHCYAPGRQTRAAPLDTASSGVPDITYQYCRRFLLPNGDSGPGGNKAVACLLRPFGHILKGVLIPFGRKIENYSSGRSG